MEWQMIVALILVIPVILIPVALIWYINFCGIAITLRQARENKAAAKVTRRISAE